MPAPGGPAGRRLRCPPAMSTAINPPRSITKSDDLRREATPGPAVGLSGRPALFLAAPTECWWALAIVESLINGRVPSQPDRPTPRRALRAATRQFGGASGGRRPSVAKVGGLVAPEDAGAGPAGDRLEAHPIGQLRLRPRRRLATLNHRAEDIPGIGGDDVSRGCLRRPPRRSTAT